MNTIYEIRKIFTDELDKYNIEYIAEVVNNNKCISISNKDIVFDMEDSLVIWIRLLNYNNNTTIEISTIQLPKSIRRKGVLSKIFKKLVNYKYINSISVTGVSTDEMLNWCKKHNMITNNDYDFVFAKKIDF